MSLLTIGRTIELEVDGQAVRVLEGQTILDACTKLAIETPTLCYGPTLKPKNACRVCVVELEGARVLAPACSRKAEAGMMIRTDSERVRQARRMVLEPRRRSHARERPPRFRSHHDGAWRAQPPARPGYRP